VSLLNEAQILLIDPDREQCLAVTSLCQAQRLRCLQADTLAQARSLLATHKICLAICETVLADGAGFDLLPELSKNNQTIPVIYLTASGSVNQAKEAIRRGAFDYYEKPVDLKILQTSVCQAISSSAGYHGPDRRKFASPSVGQPDSAYRDDLTGLASHRYVLGKLPRLHMECCKKGIPLSLCLIDIDGFGKINDRRGLSAGDSLLIESAQRLRHIVRADDIVCRYGADEFLLVLPGADQASASGLSERIKSEFANSYFNIADEKVKLALCIGVVEIDSNECINSVEFLERAAEAMHHAKLQGPDAVVVWRKQLAQETTAMVDLGDPANNKPDIESINVMMWRFRQLNRRLNNVTMESLQLLVAAVEARDPYTKHHSVRVASFTRYLAGELGLPEGQIRTIYSAALLHDIGKIGVPDAVLTKPGRLTEQEFQLIRQHPTIAVNILEQAQFFMAELPLVKHHHEWFNGRGYPDGLAGMDIPLGSRIIQIADCTEAMLARRSYKESYDLEHTVHQLQEGAGSQFDPALAELAVRVINQGILQQLWRGKESAGDELKKITSFKE
jgi:diguanylate cyclase (GGDEF)-like protein/putative nucleotidyltransferase with HDIG domain